MKLLPLLYQCIFYTGSWVRQDKYQDLLQHLQQNKDIQNIRFHKPFETLDKSRNDTILIGHSLGGYFALLDAMKHPENIAGVVLLNSHFNSRWVMPYPGVPVNDIQTPVFTILAGEDDRLSIRKSLDDAWECAQEGTSNKFFKVNPKFSHWTGITETNGQDTIINDISTFITALKTGNYTSVRHLETYKKRFHPENFDLSNNAVVASHSVNVIDAILGILMPHFIWKYGHFLWFLTLKPDDILSFLYVGNDHIFLKGKHNDKNNYEILLKEWLRDTPFEIRDYYLPMIHPSILFWLWFPLQPQWKNNTIVAPRIIFEINNQTTYYKVPNPRKFFTILPNSSFFDF